jgi:hypothetical protein
MCLLLGGAVAILTAIFFFSLIPAAAAAGPLLALAYLSLPFQLVLERGNNDLIVFLWLALLALALSAEGRRSAAAAGTMAFPAVATKIIPLFGIVATWGVRIGVGSGHRSRPGNLRWALLGGLAGLGLVLPWLAPILKNAPDPRQPAQPWPAGPPELLSKDGGFPTVGRRVQTPGLHLLAHEAGLRADGRACGAA